jgi:cytoplasmic tRNA 2-thiolation protein 2
MASCEIGSNAEELMPRRRKILSKSCIKCKTDSGNLLVRGLVYCKACLQTLVVQKFKKSIDECIRPAASSSAVLAVGFSGGLGSTVLLHLVAQSLVSNSQRTRRHRWDEIHIIHVYDLNSSGLMGSENVLDKIESAVAAYPSFRLSSVPMDQSFEGDEYGGLSVPMRSHFF